MAARFSGCNKKGNPLWGHGFAEMKNGEARWTGKVELIESQLTLPLTWKEPRKIFVNSTSDLFHEWLPDGAIDRIFAVMALCPQHTFQVLTKRPERMRDYLMHMAVERVYSIACRQDETLADRWFWPPPNVWLGTSCEDQETAGERIPLLLDTPAAVRFVSCEPLLGPIDLTEVYPVAGSENAWHALRGIRATPDGTASYGPGLDWVIVGGESGPNARPMHPEWARSLRKQCETAGVAYYFKQWGEWLPANQGPAWRDYENEICPHVLAVNGALSHGDELIGGGAKPRWAPLQRVGKARAGRLLDGREYSQFPLPQQPQ
jgi:protein gp37